MSFVTLVTPDMPASIHCYRDVLGFELLREAPLGGRVPVVAGAEVAGRPCALLRMAARHGPECHVRLLAAPPGAAANRPGGISCVVDSGLWAMQFQTAHDAAVFNRLVAAGIHTLSWPQYYHLDQVLAEHRWQAGYIESKTFSAIGPAGEVICMQRELSAGGSSGPGRPATAGQFAHGIPVLCTRDRWPLLEFYRTVADATTSAAFFLQQDPVNVAIGAPPGSYFQFARLSGGVAAEWREFRAHEPEAAPPFPTSLDRTGLAMITIVVSDPAAARIRIEKAGIKTLGSGALPTVGGECPDGFCLRGPVGELVEVVGADG